MNESIVNHESPLFACLISYFEVLALLLTKAMDVSVSSYTGWKVLRLYHENAA